MRKDELLYLHQLLTAVRREFDQRGDADPAAFEAYDDLSVSPVAAYERKSLHKHAVLLLAAGLAACAGEGDATTVDHRQSASS